MIVLCDLTFAFLNADMPLSTLSKVLRFHSSFGEVPGKTKVSPSDPWMDSLRMLHGTRHVCAPVFWAMNDKTQRQKPSCKEHHSCGNKVKRSG